MFKQPEFEKFSINHADQFYIGGRWVKPSTTRSFIAVDPATEEVLVHVAEAVEADIDCAVAAARQAFDHGPWPRMEPRERAKYLTALAGALRERSADLGHAWTREAGILFSISKDWSNNSASFVDQHAAWATTFPWEERLPTTDGLGGHALLVQEPVGVVAAIVPWNASFALSLVKIIPALLAGCTVILKASPEGALGPLVLMDIIESLGLPPGVINFLTADRQASEHLVRNVGVDKVSFTGSTAAGRKIGSICGERIARCTLELGGKSAALIMDDYDIETAAATLAQTTSFLTNQVCAALSRVVVPRKRQAQMIEALANQFKQIRIGNPYDPETQMGPLAMKRQLERVMGYVDTGLREATLITGGRRPTNLDRGYYIEPTLFADVDPRSVIAQDEIFGPVIVIIPAEDEEDAIRIANDSIYGLDGAVFTNDQQRAYNVARQIRTGTVAQNLLRMDFGVSFGGVKQSGVGREGGIAGLRSFLDSKTILLQD